jgi:putative ABC transport system permease protein
MIHLRTTNRAMFWRIIRRLLSANPGRLFVMLLALGAGAAVTSALLNLQVDAKRRLTSEFRAFGPNIAIVPAESGTTAGTSGTIDEALLKRVPDSNEGNQVVRFGVLALIADVSPVSPKSSESRKPVPVVVVGYTGGAQQEILERERAAGLAEGLPYCNLGVKAASALGVHERDRLNLLYGSTEEICSVGYVLPYGGQQDNQISVHISTAQHLTGLSGRLSSIQVVATGTPASIDRFVALLTQSIPEASVRPIRQFTEGEARIYNRISGLLTTTVGIVLLLTALCVMAAMTNVAMERKMDVGLMKAIGGATRRVVRLFLAEAALLGLAGGAIGAAAGIFLSIGLGKAVFGVAARPRLIVYPVTVALTVIVAILSAYPLRRVASIRPASVFRGEA